MYFLLKTSVEEDFESHFGSGLPERYVRKKGTCAIAALCSHADISLKHVIQPSVLLCTLARKRRK
jgi:hypothetical protein